MIKVKNRKILLLPGDGIGPEVVAEVSRGIGEAMKGLDVFKLSEEERLQTRGV